MKVEAFYVFLEALLQELGTKLQASDLQKVILCVAKASRDLLAAAKEHEARNWTVEDLRHRVDELERRALVIETRQSGNSIPRNPDPAPDEALTGE